MRHATNLALALVIALSSAAHAQSLDATLSTRAAYGIDRSSAALMRYNFATGQVQSVGTVRASDGRQLKNIEGAAYFNGFQNAFAFWIDPSAKKNRLVYIDLSTARGTLMGAELEGGKITGAAALHSPPDRPWKIYGMQNVKTTPPATIQGMANINPANNDDFEFTLRNGESFQFTRDHLLAAQNLPANGTYYQGPATYIRVRPKGNGNQNSLVINGEQFTMQNSNTYEFAGSMVVRVFNDHINPQGKAMGKWWLEVSEGEVIINNDVQVLSPDRLCEIDQHTGTVTEIMPLTRSYSGLATRDGVTFYTGRNNDLYVINTDAGTETKIGTTSLGKIIELEFVGDHLIAYDVDYKNVVPLNPETGASTASPANLGLGDSGAIFFAPLTHDPFLAEKVYD